MACLAHAIPAVATRGYPAYGGRKGPKRLASLQSLLLIPLYSEGKVPESGADFAQR